MQSQQAAEAVPDCASRLGYYYYLDTSFLVMSDQHTLIGVSSVDCKTIFKENVLDKSAPITLYSAGTVYVNTLAIDEPNNVLFAGSSNFGGGQVVQYDLESGRVLRNYGDVKIGRVMSSCTIKNLWVFGSYRAFKLIVIDSINRKVVHEPVATAVYNIFSMTVRNVNSGESSPKVLLFVAGTDSTYSGNCTDVLDITGLFDHCRKPLRNAHRVSPTALV